MKHDTDANEYVNPPYVVEPDAIGFSPWGPALIAKSKTGKSRLLPFPTT